MTKNGPQVRAWAEGQARRPMRHGPQGTACLHGPIAIVPGQPVTVPCRAGPARCPGMAQPQLLCCHSYFARPEAFFKHAQVPGQNNPCTAATLVLACGIRSKANSWVLLEEEEEERLLSSLCGLGHTPSPLGF